MKKVYFTILASMLLSYTTCLKAQDVGQNAAEFQKELNEQYSDPEESPLKGKAKRFKGHDFFEIDSALCVEARFVKSLNALPFRMKTTTNRRPTYEKYGEAQFVLYGKELRLSIYQNHELRETAEYKNYLFLPFTDLTNGDESYGGGRFIDLEIPTGNTITIDFNKAYNPYCAYNKDYSCPIPPAENDLPILVRAGVKKPKK